MKTERKTAGLKEKPAGIAEKVVCMLDIITRIEQGQCPSPSGLADEFGLTRRSIHRYLEIINFIVPIEYDKEAKGYRFVSASPLQKISLSDQERLLLLVLGDAVSHLGGGLREHYQGLIGKIASASHNRQIGIDDLPIAFNMASEDSENAKRNLPSISDAIINKNSVDIRYHAVHSNEVTDRRVDPYGLIFSDGNWLMIGFCHLDQDIRKFDLNRILEMTQSWLKFKKPDFDLQQYIDERWGLYDGEKTEVTVRFKKEIAHLITRKKKWHPSERRVILPSGDVELTFTVAGTEKLKRWIYSWMPNVKVIAPKHLRAEVRKNLMSFTTYNDIRRT